MRVQGARFGVEMSEHKIFRKFLENWKKLSIHR